VDEPTSEHGYDRPHGSSACELDGALVDDEQHRVSPCRNASRPPPGDGVVKRIPRTARDAAARAGIKVGDNMRVRGYRWVSILDSQTSQVCRSLDGQTFSFGKGPLPPAHPNCRSNIVAELLGRWMKRDAKGRFAKDERTRPTPDGAVPARVTYYDWLKTQEAAFQDDVLGVTRAALFRKGGLSAEAFARLNLDRNFEPMTLDEMRKRAPLIFKRAGL
jgi:hypothetical protein